VFGFSVQLLSEIFIILRRVQKDVVNVLKSSRKVPVGYSGQILIKTRVLSADFLKILKYQTS
jgi:hypothetical protein